LGRWNGNNATLDHATCSGSISRRIEIFGSGCGKVECSVAFLKQCVASRIATREYSAKSSAIAPYEKYWM
jgi:hypothetical protein